MENLLAHAFGKKQSTHLKIIISPKSIDIAWRVANGIYFFKNDSSHNIN